MARPRGSATIVVSSEVISHRGLTWEEGPRFNGRGNWRIVYSIPMLGEQCSPRFLLPLDGGDCKPGDLFCWRD